MFFKVSHIRKDKDYSFSLILLVKKSICVGKILELRIISKKKSKIFWKVVNVLLRYSSLVYANTCKSDTWKS